MRESHSVRSFEHRFSLYWQATQHSHLDLCRFVHLVIQNPSWTACIVGSSCSLTTRRLKEFVAIGKRGFTSPFQTIGFSPRLRFFRQDAIYGIWKSPPKMFTEPQFWSFGWWFGTFTIFSIYWEFHHRNWRTHIFQLGFSTTNQIYRWWMLIIDGIVSDHCNDLYRWIYHFFNHQPVILFPH